MFHQVLVDAGLEDVTVEPFPFTLTWATPEVYVEWIKDVFIDLRDLIDEHAAARADEVYEAIAGAVASHACHDGQLAFDNTALMGTGPRTP